MQFRLTMTCCVCSRAYHAHVISETGCSTNPELLPETGSTEAHRLEETILFDKVSARKHFRWRHTKYWLRAIAGLTGKCRPEVIANLAARSPQPICHRENAATTILCVRPHGAKTSLLSVRVAVGQETKDLATDTPRTTSFCPMLWAKRELGKSTSGVAHCLGSPSLMCSASHPKNI